MGGPALTNVNNALILEHLRHIQMDIDDIKQMRSEMQEEFASTRQQLAMQRIKLND